MNPALEFAVIASGAGSVTTAADDLLVGEELSRPAQDARE